MAQDVVWVWVTASTPEMERGAVLGTVEQETEKRVEGEISVDGGVGIELAKISPADGGISVCWQAASEAQLMG